MCGARYMTLGVMFRRPRVDHAKIGRGQLCLQLFGCDKQRFAFVLLFHSLPITLEEMALQSRKRMPSSVRLMLCAVVLSFVYAIFSGFSYRLALPGRKLTFPA